MLRNIHDTILSWDYSLWYLINTKWHTPLADTIIPFLRNQWFWAPLYLFLAVLLPVKFKKNGMIWCLLFLITFIISDQLSAHLLKPIFHRLRPCNDPYLADIVRVLVPCGSGYSFPSSHAANHFSMGLFSAVTLGRIAKWVWPVAIVWALMVSFSQVYVGVHFPLDVFCGGLVGSMAGIATGKFFNHYFALNKPGQVTPRS